MAHDHGHSHFHRHHAHEHPVRGREALTRAFQFGIILNGSFVVTEVIYGFYSNSLSLLADAGHNFGDVLGLILAWGAAHLSKKEASDRYSYGLKSTSIVAALANSSFLMIAVGAIILEAVQRFFNPHPVEAQIVMSVAGVGIFINGLTAYLFSRENKDDLNVRAAFLHMLSDALVALGVVISAFLVMKTGWQWLDPVVSIGISIAIFWGTQSVLKESLNLALHGVPSHIDLKAVREFLLHESGVLAIHDLHVWAMSTTEVALSCHLSTADPEAFLKSGRLQKISREIEDHFGIVHSTIQVDHESDVAECVNDGGHDH